MRVERSAAFGAIRASQTLQVVSAFDTGRNTAFKEFVPQELRNVPVQEPKTENTTNDDHRDRQDQVACYLTNRQSKAPHDLAKHQRRRHGESDRCYNCHKECRSQNELTCGSSHGRATVLLTWEQPDFRVHSQIEMTNRASKSTK